MGWINDRQENLLCLQFYLCCKQAVNFKQVIWAILAAVSSPVTQVLAVPGFWLSETLFTPRTVTCPGDSPGQNAGVGSHSLLQGIFPS